MGSPLADNKQPGTHASGALFKCNVPSIRETYSNPYCDQVETDGYRGTYLNITGVFISGKP